MKRVLLLAALFGATACDLVRDPMLITEPEGAVMVHAMLRADAHEAKVLITRAMREDSTGDIGSPFPVEGAIVDLVHGADTLRLPLQGADADPCWRDSFSPLTDLTGACYAGDVPFGIEPGEEYVLRASLPDGTLVTGRVTVPAAPAIIAPVDGTRIRESSSSQDDMLMRWSHPSDPLLLLVFAADDPDCQIGFTIPGFPYGLQFMRTVTGRDTISVGVRAICSPQKQRVEGSLVLTALDAGYARYWNDGNSNDWRSLSSAAVNIEGALGVFAASASHAVQVVLEIPGAAAPEP